jgi:hypothetical protein
MEGRQMLSAVPTFQTLYIPPAYNIVAPLSGMENTVIRGGFQYGTSSDASVQANLMQGQAYVVSLDVQHAGVGGNQPSALNVISPGGYAQTNPVSTLNGPMLDMITGGLTWDSQAIFYARRTGLTTFNVSEYSTGRADDTYTLTIRPIGLDTSVLSPEASPSDAQKLGFTGGGLYAFLDKNQNTLTFSGPTGRGFQIAGQFAETTLSSGNFTYSTIWSTSPNLTLETAVGNIPITLPAGTQLSVTTKPDGYRGYFGEVASAGIQFPYQTLVNQLVEPIVNGLGSVVNQANEVVNSLGLDAGVSASSINLGIGLGSTVQSLDPNAPVNPAVPYLYLVGQHGFSGQVGQVNLNIANSGGSIVVDPSDPSVFVHAYGMPFISDVSLAISPHGYVPFTPTVTPSHFQGQTLYGDVAVSGTVDLNDLTGDLIPATVSGTIDVNFDTRGGAWSSTVLNEVKGVANGQLNQVSDLSHVAIGVNGTLSVSAGFAKVGALTFPVAGGTTIFSGPQQAVYFAGGTINPLAGTPLAFLDNGASITADGYLTESGSFDMKLQTGYSLLGYQVANGTVEITNSGVSANGWMGILGSQAWIAGNFNFDGTFNVSGGVYDSYYVDLSGGSGFGWSGGVGAWLNFSFDQTGSISFNASADVYGDFWWWGQDVYSFNIGQNFGFQTNLFSDLKSAVDRALENELFSFI